MHCLHGSTASPASGDAGYEADDERALSAWLLTGALMASEEELIFLISLLATLKK